MDIQAHTQPDKLERYSFVWSEARLILAAIALFLGGTPLVALVFRVIPGLSSLGWGLLQLAWIISGIVSAYLLYRWNLSEKKVFGGTDNKDMIAFFINVISGFNLGWTGLTHNNIGMSIAHGQVVFGITGIVYLFAAWHLYQRWKSHGEKVF